MKLLWCHIVQRSTFPMLLGLIVMVGLTIAYKGVVSGVEVALAMVAAFCYGVLVGRTTGRADGAREETP